ncbi:MAG: undecaprenyl-diphosphate phosphatase, partial [Planctomycetaceae bacterium]|nr:undecaprenyl-diphosphate phosphatase [Planctomycetaceae bacterium]
REAAAKFSFLIAIPAISGAAVLESVSLIRESTSTNVPWTVLATGAVVAFVVGILALQGLLKVIAARKLHAFAWYCLTVGLLTIGISTYS